MSTHQCGGKGHGARRPPAPISARPWPPLQNLSASVSPPRQYAYILVPHDQPRISARSGRRPPVGYERGGAQITRFGATLGVHLGDQVAGHNESAGGLPSDSTTYRNRYPDVPMPQGSTMPSLAARTFAHPVKPDAGSHRSTLSAA